MISIIIPLYNKQHVIKNTINSILTQSVSDWECIIVDDGSTDSSASVVRGIDDKRIKYLYKSNGGVSSARNFGVEHASGEWILFLDADDLLLEDCLATFYQYNSSKNIDIIAANFYLVNGNKSVAHNFCVKEGILSHPFRNFFMGRLYMRPGSFIIRKDKAIQYPYNTKFSRYEDYEVQINYMLNCRILILNNIVMEYRMDNSELSMNNTNFQSDYLSYLEIPKKGFWYRMIIYRMMYVALRSYWKNPLIRDRYLKHSFMIGMSNFIYLISLILNKMSHPR